MYYSPVVATCYSPLLSLVLQPKAPSSLSHLTLCLKVVQGEGVATQAPSVGLDQTQDIVHNIHP